MTYFFIRTNLREFYVEAAGIGAALEMGMFLCIDKIEWIVEADARQPAAVQVAA